MEIIEKHIVPDGIAKQRLSDYACTIFETLSSKNGIKKAIKSQRILINERPTSTGVWVKPGTTISLIAPEESTAKIYKQELEVVFEDEYLAIINKPAGITVSANQFKSIKNALAYNLKKSTCKDALADFQPVHRLDNPTSGLLIIAKTTSSRIDLGKQFEEKTVKKRYRAIVMGKIKSTGIINSKIDEKEALTKYEVVKTVKSLKSEYLSMIDLFPETGRKHQLRKHLSEIGNPILGDKLYGEKGNILRGKGLFLCAVQLDFIHPNTKEKVKYRIDVPTKFTKILDNENKRWNKFSE